MLRILSATEDEICRVMRQVLDPHIDSGGMVDFSDSGPGDALIRELAEALIIEFS
jgi:hypothetical protein